MDQKSWHLFFKKGANFFFFPVAAVTIYVQKFDFFVSHDALLYHNKKHQGTTTHSFVPPVQGGLYHNKKHQGTTTTDIVGYVTENYTTTRNIRELQPSRRGPDDPPDYTTTRNIRELQPWGIFPYPWPIIPQQETSGNYNGQYGQEPQAGIIPQQETSGNYNLRRQVSAQPGIIPQQETSGNYNTVGFLLGSHLIIPQQETSGNYNRRWTTLLPPDIIPQQETSGVHILIHRLIFCNTYYVLRTTKKLDKGDKAVVG